MTRGDRSVTTSGREAEDEAAKSTAAKGRSDVLFNGSVDAVMFVIDACTYYCYKFMLGGHGGVGAWVRCVWLPAYNKNKYMKI